MTLRSSDLQSDSDLDSIRNSCDVYYLEGLFNPIGFVIDGFDCFIIHRINFVKGGLECLHCWFLGGEICGLQKWRSGHFWSRMNMTTSNILRHLFYSPLPGFGCSYIPLPVYILGAQQLLLLPSASDEITIRSVQLNLSWLDLLPKKLREFGTSLSFKKNHSNEI